MTNHYLRREVIGGLGGVALFSVAEAFAEVGLPTTMSNYESKTTEGYPRPPFPRQPQMPPGLASRMVPRPDHGEKTYRGSGRLLGRKALITGGDSGIGRAVAIAFAREGADVAIGYLPAEESDAREVLKLIRAEGRTAIPIPGDIRDEEFCRKMVRQAAEGLGSIDILVNNAARQQSVESIVSLTTDEFDWTFKTNVYAMFWITQEALRYMQSGSSIINTSSVQAAKPGSNLLDYAASKAAIIAFSKSLAKQLARDSIRVNVVAPGPYWTPLQVSGGQPEAVVMNYGGDSVYGRPGQPVEIAPLYVTLASTEASYASGQVWGADGANGVL